MIKNYGLKIISPKETDYIFGSALPMEIIQENGQWDAYLPAEEKQAPNGFETQACTSFGTTSALETLLNKLNVKVDFSDRWLAKESGTLPDEGNDPGTVCETLRKIGVPYQEYWDFGPDIKTVQEFYKNPPPKLFDYAREDFLNLYDFKHEIVNPNEIAIKSALQCSPLGVGVSAWFPDENGINHSKGVPNNHWVVLYGYDDDKKAWKIFDSYDGFRKLYSYDSEISMAKRFWIKKKNPQEIKSLWNIIKSICLL